MPKFNDVYHFNMKRCEMIKQNTENRLKVIGLATLINGILNRDLRPQTLVDNFVGTAKYVWNNDEQARSEAIEAVICELTS